jgi:hypothetical protein
MKGGQHKIPLEWSSTTAMHQKKHTRENVLLLRSPVIRRNKLCSELWFSKPTSLFGQ